MAPKSRQRIYSPDWPPALQPEIAPAQPKARAKPYPWQSLRGLHICRSFGSLENNQRTCFDGRFAVVSGGIFQEQAAFVRVECEHLIDLVHERTKLFAE